MRLQLTRRGDYAVRAMLALAEAGDRQLSAATIGALMLIPATFVPQVMADLSRTGMARASLGRAGGYRLARPADQISLLEVIEAIEGEGRHRTCVLRGGPCDALGQCRVHDTFSQARGAMRSVLAGTSLHDLARHEGAGGPKLTRA
jgi:Rrf2 family iron-sulfur cluster assembly transcriptional regulator